MNKEFRDHLNESIKRELGITYDEFGLLDSDFDFVISNHWDIGMGWENR